MRELIKVFEIGKERRVGYKDSPLKKMRGGNLVDVLRREVGEV
jgi:hypothetical protein